MGRARSFAEHALRAIERRQMLLIGIVTSMSLAIGTAGWLAPPRQGVSLRPLALRPPPFSARVTMIDREPFYQDVLVDPPVVSRPVRPSRIPQIVETSEFRRRLMLGHAGLSTTIHATAEPQSSIVYLTVRGTSASEAIRIANLAASELIELSRNENRILWAAWQRTREAEVAAASQHIPLDPLGTGKLDETLEGIRTGRIRYRDHATRHILEKASLSPDW